MTAAPISQQPSAPVAVQLEAHRSALTGHCYRMLGSALDADDAVQETMFRAWKAIDRFDGRSSLRTWLYRIATNVCLDALSSGAKRARPMEERPVGNTEEELTTKPRTHWLEPVPDARAIPADSDPAEELLLRESIRLAFVAALQHLPPRQRAALILAQVLNWSAAEVAETLDMTVAAVNSALQRARATLASRRMIDSPARLSAEQEVLVARYVESFERYDVGALVALLKEDATMCMPPFELWLQGRADISRWLSGRGCGCKGSVLVPTAACSSPAFGQYRQGGKEPWALIVLELEGDAIVHMNYFLDTEKLFPLFGLPMELPPKA